MTYKDTPRSRWESNAVAIIESLPRPTFQAWTTIDMMGNKKEQMMGTETDVIDTPSHMAPAVMSKRIAENYVNLDRRLNTLEVAYIQSPDTAKRIEQLEAVIDKQAEVFNKQSGLISDLILDFAWTEKRAKEQAKKIKKMERKLAKQARRDQMLWESILDLDDRTCKKDDKPVQSDVLNATVPLPEALHIAAVMSQLRALITDENVKYIAEHLPSELLLYIDTEMCVDAQDADGNAYQSVLKPVSKETVEIPF